MYAWRHPPGSAILPGDAGLTIPLDRPTLPSLLKQAGYATGAVGKWHLGMGEGKTNFNAADIKPGPREVGFDYSFLIPGTVDRVPCVYVENQHVAGLDPADPIKVSYQMKVGDWPTGAGDPEKLVLKPSHGHDMTIVNGISRIGWMTGGKAALWKDDLISDTIAGKAVSFIESNKDKPFFLYFATHDIHVPRVPHPRFRGTSGAGTRGDVIQEADDAVGQVLAALDRLKLADDTLVIFSSDNGGVIDDGYQDGAPEAYKNRSPNAPLRGFKGSLYEGGTREPLIVRWPAKVKPGQTSGALVCLVDLPATLCAIVGLPLPKDACLDSFNVAAELTGGQPDKPSRDTLVTHNGGKALAIRKGQWKLIPSGPGAARAGGGAGKRSAANNAPAGGGQTGKPGAGYGSGPMNVPQLFNLSDDIGETKNLAPEKPELVKELTELLEKSKADGRTRPG
jgi:arylsulfatase A-like enzyme